MMPQVHTETQFKVQPTAYSGSEWGVLY